MRVAERAQFSVEIPLAAPAAIDFVRRIEYSLAEHDALADVHVAGTNPVVVHASVPVKAAMFGSHTLSFASELQHEPNGAALVPITPHGETAHGWAEVSGTALVDENGEASSTVHYDFEFSAELRLPGMLRWGERALKSMIEVTAQNILQRVSAEFPVAIQRAATRYQNELLPHTKIRKD